LLLKGEAHGLGFSPMIKTIFESDNQWHLKIHLNNVKVIETIATVNLVDYLVHKHVNLFSINLLHIRQVWTIEKTFSAKNHKITCFFLQFQSTMMMKAKYYNKK
jgi:hypothetical protein